jgi:DNA-directed RNA polymerase specialized sigma24 family protein
LSATDPKPLASTVVRDDEARLVSAAKAGNAAAFEELVNRYERRIFRLTLNITQNREDAQDAAQDAFLKSFQNLDRFQGDSRFYTWLVRIAVNEALMRLRKRRPNVVSLDEPVVDQRQTPLHVSVGLDSIAVDSGVASRCASGSRPWVAGASCPGLVFGGS